MRTPSFALLAALAATALGACVGTVGDSPYRPGAEADDNSLAAPAMRRLTASQYEATVRSLFGPGTTVPVTLESDGRVNGFVAVGTSRSTVSPRAAELYEEAALTIAEAAFGDVARRTTLVPCTPSATIDARCAREFIAQFGRRAWRRPLESDEVDRYGAIADQAAEVLGDFYGGLAIATAGLMQSPNFLFRVEVGEQIASGRRRYTSLEMASRLSYLLWNGPPDEELLSLGERGELADPSVVRSQAERMLADDRSAGALRSFFDELLRLDGLQQLTRDRTVFPAMTATLGAAMRESTLRTIEAHLASGGSYRELFTTRTVFVDAELAAFYGVPAPRDGWGPADLPESGPRAGLLGHASILALLSHTHASSPTVRGKFVRESLLCQSIPPPPADVGELPEPTPDLPTMRERLAEHRRNPACAGCHGVTDPIGLGLENFDALGGYRAQENGVTIDPTGELDGIPFDDARGLGAALAQHPELTTCLVRNLYRYGTGHVESGGEEPTIRALAESFREEPQVARLLVELVSSEGFRHGGDLR